MSIEPIVPAHVIRTDEEAISVADEVAKIIRKGAIDRDQKRLLPQFEVELLSRRGLYGLSVPKKYGGAGVSTVTVGNVFRILAAADPSIAQIPQNHFCWSAVLWLGTPEQEAFFFAKFLAGERLGNAASENTRKRPCDHETVAKRVLGGYAVTGKMTSGLKVMRQTIGREDALIAYTRRNAFFVFQEDNLGAIQPGKLADLLVLDRDYLTIPADQIKDIKPVLTMVGGRIVFDESSKFEVRSSK